MFLKKLFLVTLGGKRLIRFFLGKLYTVKAQHRWISSSANSCLYQTIPVLCFYLDFSPRPTLYV